MFSIQTLIAVLFTIGIAVAVTLAFAVAGALYQRQLGHTVKALHPVTSPPQPPAQNDEIRELVRL
jgi:uncharacterized membrane protein YciS (DUF1049 family)